MLLDVNCIYRSHVFLFLITVDDIGRHEHVSRDFQRQRRTSLKVSYHHKRCKLCSLLLNYTTIYKHITSYKLV